MIGVVVSSGALLLHHAQDCENKLSIQNMTWSMDGPEAIICTFDCQHGTPETRYYRYVGYAALAIQAGADPKNFDGERVDGGRNEPPVRGGEPPTFQEAVDAEQAAYTSAQEAAEAASAAADAAADVLAGLAPLSAL
jgi:hypothetical protein